MRLSTDTEDPGYYIYRSLSNRSSIKILLDCVQLKGVFTADEEQRYVIQAVLDDNGCYQLNEDRTDVLKRKLYGNVVILYDTKPNM